MVTLIDRDRLLASLLIRYERAKAIGRYGVTPTNNLTVLKRGEPKLRSSDDGKVYDVRVSPQIATKRRL
jgi:hypothetical protein